MNFVFVWIYFYIYILLSVPAHNHHNQLNSMYSSWAVAEEVDLWVGGKCWAVSAKDLSGIDLVQHVPDHWCIDIIYYVTWIGNFRRKSYIVRMMTSRHEASSGLQLTRPVPSRNLAWRSGQSRVPCRQTKTLSLFSALFWASSIHPFVRLVSVSEDTLTVSIILFIQPWWPLWLKVYIFLDILSETTQHNCQLSSQYGRVS